MIGQTIWIYDGNHRVYPPRQPGGYTYAGRSPIYRESWVPHEIVGETRLSWITKRGRKVAKKDDGRRLASGIAMTRQELEDDVFAHDHRYKIERMLGQLPASKLREVAALIGYRP